MLRSHLAATAVCAGLLCFGTGAADADTILYDNLNGTTNPADSIALLGPLADSFSTSTSRGSLTDVQVRLIRQGAPQGSITVNLLSDNSTAPGMVLTTIGTLDDTAISTSLANYDFPLATPFGLAASTRYWIELSSNNLSNSLWGRSTDISGPGVANEFVDALGVFPNSDDPFQMQITSGAAIGVAAAAEPGTLWLMGIGIAGLVGGSWLRLQEECRTRPAVGQPFQAVRTG
jgi:hypothetical protein